MFSTRKTVTIVALALAGALSVGAVASAQAQSGHEAASRLDHPTPASSVTPSVGDDNGLRGNGTVDDDSTLPVTPTTTPAPSSGLPTDADHPQGDDSIGREAGDDADESDDVADDSHSGVSDDGAGHDVGDDNGAGHDVGDDNGGNSGHGSDDSGHSGSRH
jgi:hypothetical protein